MSKFVIKTCIPQSYIADIVLIRYRIAIFKYNCCITYMVFLLLNIITQFYGEVKFAVGIKFTEEVKFQYHIIQIDSSNFNCQ